MKEIRICDECGVRPRMHNCDECGYFLCYCCLGGHRCPDEDEDEWDEDDDDDYSEPEEDYRRVKGDIDGTGRNTRESQKLYRRLEK